MNDLDAYLINVIKKTKAKTQKQNKQQQQQQTVVCTTSFYSYHYVDTSSGVLVYMMISFVL